MEILASQPLDSATARAGFSGKEFKTDGYSLSIWISDNKLECRCSYAPQLDGNALTLEELHAYLQSCGVIEGILADATADFVRRAVDGETQTMVLVASGIGPVDGEDGFLSYVAKPSIVVTHEIDEAADIDLHNVQTFINVIPADKIARIMPPTSGRPGRGVTGEVVPPRVGNPINLKIGANITLAENGALLVAEAAGRVSLAGGEISVAEEYVISGDVNFRVGSIVFNGFVEVRGDVLDGFNVTAVKGLRVNGNIGACNIQSDGDISFCGMDGQEKGTIHCGGSVTANFIHDALVECAGSVNAEIELHNCQILSLGKITVAKGAIAGGSYTALGGIETRKAGSPASVKTVLRAGIDYRDMIEFERLVAELEANAERMKQAADLHQIEELRNVRKELTEKLLAIRNKNHDQANPKINIKQMLYDNTFLCIGMAPKQRVEEREGPLSLIENSIEGGIRFLPMTSLDVKAVDVERAFVREQAMHSHNQAGR